MTETEVSSEIYGETWKVSEGEDKCMEISSPASKDCDDEVRDRPPPVLTYLWFNPNLES